MTPKNWAENLGGDPAGDEQACGLHHHQSFSPGPRPWPALVQPLSRSLCAGSLEIRTSPGGNHDQEVSSSWPAQPVSLLPWVHALLGVWSVQSMVTPFKEGSPQGATISNLMETNLRKSNRVPEKKKTSISALLTSKAFDCVDYNKLWKILQERWTPDHLTWLLRNLYAGQEVTVRTRHGTTDWFQIGKGVCQGCILSPYLFNLYAENIMGNARLEEAQATIKIAGRNINNLRWYHTYGRK